MPNCTFKKSIKFLSFLLTFFAFLFVVNEGSGQLYWRTDGTSGSWTGNNWSNPATPTGGSTWVSSTIAIFSENSTVTFATTTIGDVTVDAGKTVNINNLNTLTYGGVRIFTIGTGSTLNWTSQTITANSSGGLLKNGSGILNINALNYTTLTGGFTLNNGTLIVSGSKSLGSANLTINGGTLQSSGSHSFIITGLTIGGDFTLSGTGVDIYAVPVSLGSTTRTITNSTSSGSRNFSGIISGNSGVGLTIDGSGSGTVILSGANTYTGLTTISGGTLQLNRTGGTTIPITNSVTISGGTLKVSTNQTINDLTLSSGTLTVDAGTTLTINGTYNATGGTINNLGTIIYAGVSVTFPGTGVTINNGTASTLTNLSIASSGTVTLGSSLIVSGTLTLTSGTFEVASNTLTLNGAAIAITPTNLTTTSSSSLSFGGSATSVAIPTSVTALNNLTINNANGVSLNSNLTLSGTLALTSGTLSVGANILTIDAATTGSGTLTFANGATFKAATDAHFTVANNIILTSGTLNIPHPFGGSGTFTFTGVISGAGAINNTSDLSGRAITINNSKSFTGGYTLNGTGSGYPGVTFNNASAFGTGTITSTIIGVDYGRGLLEPSVDLSGGSGVTNNFSVAGASDRFVFFADGSRNLQLSGIISGSGYIVKTGSATLTLTGANSYAGTTLVNAGTLILNKTGGTTIPVTNNVTVNAGTLQISSNQTLNNLTVASGAVLTVDAGVTLTVNGIYELFSNNSGSAGTIVINGTLRINQGAWAGSLGTFTYGASSTLIYNHNSTAYDVDNSPQWPSVNGPVNVSITGNVGINMFVSRTINGVLSVTNGTFNTGSNTISLGGSASATFAPGTTLNISGGTTNFNNRPVTFKSDNTGTARLAQISGTLSNATNVTVERYITASSNRAYRLLSPSLTPIGTIKSNWQEGVNNTTTGTNVNSPTALFGTHITGTGGTTNGFDETINNQASLYTYTPGIGYTAVTSTGGALSASTGYLLFIRGNRDNLNTLNTTTGSSNTTLRTTGTLVTGTQNIATSIANNFVLIGNPYASPIRWDATTGLYTGANATNFDPNIYIWDPNVSTRGGYITITSTGTISGGTTNLTQDIQNGQAFFVKRNAVAGTPTFDIAESNKSSTNNLNVFRPGLQEENLRANLFFTHTDNTRRSADGVVISYNNNNNAALDGNDAIQMINTDEDVAISQSGSFLSIESRPLADIGDTVLLNIARLREINYEWEFTATNFSAPALTAYLQDNFNNTETVINLTGSTVIPFTVTSDVASKAANRFRIVYKPTVPLPLNINSIKAYQKQAGVQVEWIVSNEINLDKYEVEKSNSSFKFELLAKIATKDNSNTENSYAAFDTKPFSITNFYRIKAIDKNGEFKYSEIVKVNFANVKSCISVYPNPTKGDQVFINVDNLPTGKYELRVTNTLGQELFKKSLFSDGNTNQQIINTMHWAKGMYNITLEGADTQLQQTIIKQ